MPDLSKCVKDREGNIWCWDRETQSVVMLVMKRPAVAKIPAEVLIELLKATERPEGRED